MKKRVLASVLAGLCALTLLTGCGGDTGGSSGGSAASGSGAAAGGEKTYKIGLMLATQNQWNTVFTEGAQDWAAENGIELVAQIADEDISKQISQIQTCAASDYDAVIIQPVQNDSSPELLAAAGDLVAVFANRMPTDISILDGVQSCYVGSNEYDFGYYEGEGIAKVLKEQGETEAKVVLFRAPLGQDSGRLRSEGAEDALTEAGLTVTFAYDNTAEWDRSKAMEQMTQFLGAGIDYNCVIANNDDMALGAIEAYTAQGITEIPVPVGGIDATQVGCEAIAAGQMTCSVFQDGETMGAKSVDACISLINGEKPEGMDEDNVVWIPVVYVDSTNVQDFLE